MPNLNDARSTYVTTLAFLPNRDELPLALNARGLLGCGVEVGVQQALYSAHLLEHWEGAHLISVDPWREDATDRYQDIANVPQKAQDAIFDVATRRLARFGSRSSVWRLTSLEAAERIPHHSLDFVYLDARHDYESVLEDLNAWFDKVRPGGMIAGHDYLDGTWPAGVFGVKSAVDEFFAAHGIAVHPTLLDEPWLTWLAEIPRDVVRPTTAAVEPPINPKPTSAREQLSILLSAHGRPVQVKLSLDPTQYTQRFMIDALKQNQMYEPATSAFLASVLEEGDTFIDVGAHVGFFSTLGAALVGSSGRVISFEPEESNVRHLEEHVALNGFAHVEPVRAAAGAENSVAELWVNGDNDGGHALWDIARHGFNVRSRRQPPNRRVIDVRSIDAHCAARGIDRVKLIKIDAEGCELAVLQGAARLLQQRPVPFVVCEINDFALDQMGTNEHAIRHFMISLGYEVNVLDGSTGGIVPLAKDQQVQDRHIFNLLFRHPTAPAVRAA